MNLHFVKMIEEIEAELSSQFIPGAINWADENHDNAWSNAIDRFEEALTKAIEFGNFFELKKEGERYKLTLIDLIRKFRESKNLKQSEMFLESLSESIDGRIVYRKKQETKKEAGEEYDGTVL